MITRIKLFFELLFWKIKKNREGKLGHAHYEYFFTDYFSISGSFYEGKSILDIGCGPRGSLEWAHMAARRIGADPLANRYQELGADQHSMEYVKANAENLPFEDNTFDVVSSFNSIDHVIKLDRACSEISRVLKSGGLLLLIVDVHSRPWVTEPQVIRWDFISRYFPDFEVLEEHHLESVKNNRIYSNVRANVRARNEKKQKGVLTAKLKKIP